LTSWGSAAGSASTSWGSAVGDATQRYVLGLEFVQIFLLHSRR